MLNQNIIIQLFINIAKVNLGKRKWLVQFVFFVLQTYISAFKHCRCFEALPELLKAAKLIFALFGTFASYTTV